MARDNAAYAREYRKQYPEKAAAAVTRSKAKSPMVYIEAARRRAGLPEPTRPMPELCECCGKPPCGKSILSLDHDHVTGKFRGWLCIRCNLGIGKLGDTIAGLICAIKYLWRNR